MLRKLLLSIGLIVGLTAISFAGFKTNNLTVDYGVKTSTVQITGGSPGAGKVLTSQDADGNAVWQTPTTGVTDHGQLTSTGTLTHSQLESAITAIGASTGTIAGDLSTETTNRINGDNALGVSTGTLRTDLGTETSNRINADNAIGVSTGTLRTDLTTETNNRIAGDEALAISTTTLQSNIGTETTNRINADNAIGVSTGTLRTDLTNETNNRISADNAIGVSTGTLRTDLTNETNARIAGDEALAVSTTTLQGNINNKVDRAGDTMTGDLNLPNLNATYGVSASTITASGNIKTTGGAIQIGPDATVNTWKTVQVGADLVTYYYDGAGWVEAYRAVP